MWVCGGQCGWGVRKVIGGGAGEAGRSGGEADRGAREGSGEQRGLMQGAVVAKGGVGKGGGEGKRVPGPPGLCTKTQRSACSKHRFKNGQNFSPEAFWDLNRGESSGKGNIP